MYSRASNSTIDDEHMNKNRLKPKKTKKIDTRTIVSLLVELVVRNNRCFYRKAVVSIVLKTIWWVGDYTRVEKQHFFFNYSVLLAYFKPIR